jgi:arylsulfatase A
VDSRHPNLRLARWGMCLAAGSALLATALAVQDEQAPAPPNVILLNVDDLGWRGVGAYGAKFVDTPNIDRLAADGVLFTDAYAGAPNCSPSRASLLTGLYPTRHGITHVLPHKKPDGLAPTTPMVAPDYAPGLETDFTTMAEVFQSQGYSTAIIGKWHLGGRKYSPQQHGFELSIGGGNSHKRLYPPYLKMEGDGGLEGEPEEHITECLLRHSLKYVDEHRDGPFFLYVPFYSIHDPVGGTEALEAKYTRRFGSDRVRIKYAAMTEGIDQYVGALMAKLEATGLDQRTIVVFTSDNGGFAQIPLRRGKGFLYEGGIRVPLIIHGPDIAAGREVSAPVSHVDLAPTLLALAGLDAPVTDGLDLQPLFTDEGSLPERSIFWHYPHYSLSGGSPCSAIRQGDFKLIHWYETDAIELYDLGSDRGEKANLAERDAERAKRMRTVLDDWLEESGALFPVRQEG